MADFRHPSVRVVLALITLGTILIATSIPVTLFGISTRNNLRIEALTKTAFMAGRLAETLRFPLWYVSIVQCRQIVEIEMQNRDVSAIVLYDEYDGLLLAYQRNQDTVVKLEQPNHTTLERQALTSLSLPIIMNDMNIGQIIVYSSMAETSQTHSRTARLSMILAIATSFFMALVLFLATEHLLTRKVLDTVRVLKAFQNKDYSIRADTSGLKELRQLALSFNSMAETIQNYNNSLEALVQERTTRLIEAEKLAFLGSLVAGLAHEVNTPLGVGITAASQAAMLAHRLQNAWQQQELSERFFKSSLADIIEAVDIISSNLGRAGDFIRSFKILATDQSVEDSRKIRLADYINDIILSLKPSLKKTRHTITVDCDPKLVLEIVPGLLYQILSNLIMNSLLHAYKSETAGFMTVSCMLVSDKFADANNQKQLELKYCDDGCGIDPIIADHIFEPFFTTRKNRGGTGLGLYIIQSIVHKKGGSIEYKPNLPQGSSFTMYLPCSQLANGDHHDAFRP